MAKRTFEDFAAGDVFPLPERRVTRAEIIAFAAEFDPQPMHLDERTPATELTGGLIASGWHICAIFMRILADGLLRKSTGMGSLGVDTLSWKLPLRPGDILGGRSIVIEKRASRSRPQMGIVRFRHEAVNQAGELIMWMEHAVMFERRKASGS